MMAFALFSLSLTDWTLTSLALHYGAVEANPLMKHIVTSPDDFFLLKVVLAGVVAMAAAIIIRSRPAFAVLSSVVFLYVFLIMWNFATLHTLI